MGTGTRTIRDNASLESSGDQQPRGARLLTRLIGPYTVTVAIDPEGRFIDVVEVHVPRSRPQKISRGLHDDIDYYAEDDA